MVSAVQSSRPLLRAYIDETGDRGSSGNASPFFAFAAVLVAEEHDPQLRAAVSKLRRDFKVPTGKPLHWSQHVKPFARRQHSVNTLLSLGDRIQIVYVGVEKAGIPAWAKMKNDQATFYNFASGLVVERVLLAARHWPGGARDVVFRFGHVRGFDHTSTKDYIRLRAQRADPSWVPWGLIRGEIRFDDQASWDGLQAADQYAGMLSAALRPDSFGNYQPHHLVAIRSQMREVNGRCWNYGFKWLGNEGTLTSLPWWSTLNLTGM